MKTLKSLTLKALTVALVVGLVYAAGGVGAAVLSAAVLAYIVS